jgi:hypothetical protein
MDKNKHDQETEEAKELLVKVIKKNPGLKDGAHDIFTGNRQTIFLLGDARKATRYDQISFDRIPLKELKKDLAANHDLINSPDTAIVIAGARVAGTSSNLNINIASDYFSAHDIANNTTTIGNDHYIIIDLAQEGLVDKLKDAFYEKQNAVRPPIAKSPTGEIIDKDVAKAEVQKKARQLAGFAHKNGIGQNALIEIIKQEWPKDVNKGKGQ